MLSPPLVPSNAWGRPNTPTATLRSRWPSPALPALPALSEVEGSEVEGSEAEGSEAEGQAHLRTSGRKRRYLTRKITNPPAESAT